MAKTLIELSKEGKITALFQRTTVKNRAKDFEELKDMLSIKR